MTSTCNAIIASMRDMLGSWELADAAWSAHRAAGRIVEHRTGPESALYEVVDAALAGQLSLWLGAWLAQHPRVPRG